MTLSDKLKIRIQDSMQPLIWHSWASPQHALHIQQLNGLEIQQVFAQWFYNHIAPQIIHPGFIAIPLPPWSGQSFQKAKSSVIKWKIPLWSSPTGAYKFLLSCILHYKEQVFQNQELLLKMIKLCVCPCKHCWVRSNMCKCVYYYRCTHSGLDNLRTWRFTGLTYVWKVT